MEQIKVGNKTIGKEEKCFIVAEIGVNHNQDFDLAKKLVIEAAGCGVDAVKFQTWKTENIVLKNTEMAEYQKKNLDSNISQFEMLKSLEIPYEWHYDLKKLANDHGLIFFSTMEDKESVDFLINKLNIPLIKVGSGDLTNFPLLNYTAKLGKPLVLSTGMANLSEIDEAFRIVNQINPNIILLQCTSQYPCPIDDVNLYSMLTLKDCFPTLVGFSDHTQGIEAPIAATALGAVYIEKHFTLDKNLPGPDHKASLEPSEFKKMVEKIRITEKIMGKRFKFPLKSEMKNRTVVIRKIVAARNINKGEILNENNVTFKRTNQGLEANFYPLIKGKKVSKHISKDEVITLKSITH